MHKNHLLLFYSYLFYLIIYYYGEYMKSLIKNYLELLNIDKLKEFALKNNINLNNNELEFIYNFIKTRYKDILNNPSNFNLVKYKNNFSNEKFIKINL